MMPGITTAEVSRQESLPNGKLSITFLALTLGCLVIVLCYPWVFGLAFVLFLSGFYSVDKLAIKFPRFFKVEGSTEDLLIAANDSSCQLDPLLHTSLDYQDFSNTPTKSLQEHEDRYEPSSDRISVERSVERRGTPENPSPGKAISHQPNSTSSNDSGGGGKGANDLKIDSPLDKALSKFCTAFFDYYISSSWAPYETRLHLRLAIKSAFTSLGEKINAKLSDEEGFHQFIDEKLIPLLLHYIRKMQLSHSSFTVSNLDRLKLERLAKLRIRNLCMKLLEDNLHEEDLKCTLWFELAVGVLGDGVLWNLFLLARDGVPQLCVDQAQEFQERQLAPDAANHYMVWLLQIVWCGIRYTSDCLELIVGKVWVLVERFVLKRPGQADSQSDVLASPGFLPPAKGQVIPQIQADDQMGQKVHLLLDNFLDPSNDLNQPDWIVSRWRPSLDIILVERELLYCLIQYLKGHKALEYLQAVLDDSMDGTPYCKKVLQLEYLPRFCRSKIFMESLGISQVDCALEAGSDSPGTKMKLGHTRSASFGGGNSGIQIWKIGDPKAVDGLPLHTSPLSSSLVGGAVVEPDLIFGLRFGRNNSVESILSRFMHQAMTYYPPSSNDVELAKIPPTVRVGTDIRTYDDFNSEEVQSSLVIGKCDTYECAVEIVTSLVAPHPGLRLVSGGWLRMLRPVLKPLLDSVLKSQLQNLLTIENSVKVVDFATAAFNAGSMPTSQANAESENELKGIQSPTGNSSFFQSLISILIDPLYLAHILKDNEDELLMFLVDLLDILVNYLG